MTLLERAFWVTMSILGLLVMTIGCVIACNVYATQQETTQQIQRAAQAANDERTAILQAVQAAQTVSLGNRAALIELRELMLKDAPPK